MNLATATDLQRWADLREAQGTLPQLVRRLISATANGLVALSIRAEEGVALPGWDGVVDASEADAHVPAGRSVWEMGVGGDPLAKATRDYRKRTDDPGEVDPADSTLVFVTPRRWAGKDSWVRDREADGVWKSIVVFDADDLATWLERAPHVHAWISGILGKDPYEVENLGNWWESWAGATNPPLPPELVLSGRGIEADRVREIAASAPASLTVSGDSREEVTAFVAASLIASGDGDSSPELERALIVRTPAAWRHVAVTDLPLTLVPLFDNPDVALANRRGHAVIIPLGREVEAVSGVNLPRLGRDGIERVLSTLGFQDERLAALATLGRHSLLSLRRALAIHPELQHPEWATAENARTVLPAVLAGRWSDGRPGDRAALSQLANRPYEELARELTRWANASDPPVRRVGDVWIVAAKADAWELLARFASDDDLDRFTAVAELVIGGEDPTIGLTRDELLVASVSGNRREHSAHLLEGLADTLALFAASSDHVALAGGRRAHQLASKVVRSLFASANEDATGHRWIALAQSLPLLAEADPEAFLSAVENALLGDDPLILKLFQDGQGFDSFFGSSAHPSLLWALENVAWSVDYVGRAALILARLSRLDPGGRLANRPAASLRDVLLLWRSGTSATIDQRLEVVDLIRREEPDVAWHVLLQLIPSGRDWAGRTHSPPWRKATWRNWKTDEQRGTYDDLHRIVRELARRALDDAGDRGDRWAALLGRTADLPEDARAELITRLVGLAEDFDEEDRAIVAGELRRLIGTHREFPDAHWAMAQEDVDRLQKVLLQFEPTSPLLRHAWLFKPGALPRNRRKDLDSRRHDLAEAQRHAITECIASVGLVQVLKWAETFETNGYSQHAIGWALAAVSRSGAENVLLDALVSQSAAQRVVAAAYVSRIAQARGPEFVKWAQETIADRGKAWAPEHKAVFLAVLPSSEDLWSFAESLGPDVERLYWQRMGPYGLPMDPPARNHAARKLIGYDQPFSAIVLLDDHNERTPDPPLDLIAEALERALRMEPPGALDSMFSYHVDRHLHRLEAAGFDEERLASLEWGYLPLFRYESRQMRVLHQKLVKEPGFFAEVVGIIYRAEGEEPRDLSPEEAARAATARDMLDSWTLVPGTSEHGSIDPDALNEWVEEAREQLAADHRLRMGEHRIGQVLRYGPGPQEDQWPAPEICDVIDRVGSADFEGGFQTEVYNSRGVTTRGPTEGGHQERVLAERYRSYAAAVSLRWPRTAALLRGLAESYDADADRNDADADLREDLWR